MTTLTVHSVHTETGTIRDQHYDESVSTARGILFGLAFAGIAWVVLAGVVVGLWFAFH